MKMKTGIAIVVVAIIVLGGGWYLYASGKIGGSAGGTGQTVALVNGQTITRADLESAESQLAVQEGITASTTEEKVALQSDALNSLIAQKLLLEAAQAAGVTASSTAVDAKMAAAKAQFQSEADYEQALAAAGMNEDTLRAQIQTNIVIQTYLNQKLNLGSLTVSDAEIQTAYNQVIGAQKDKTNLPTLAEAHDEIEQEILQQKQQQLVGSYVTQLQSAGKVKVLISTSTPLAS